MFAPQLIQDFSQTRRRAVQVRLSSSRRKQSSAAETHLVPAPNLSQPRPKQATWPETVTADAIETQRRSGPPRLLFSRRAYGRPQTSWGDDEWMQRPCKERHFVALCDRQSPLILNLSGCACT
ncbi:hypothetical protein BC835DRAFT_1008630 [Cytidiella melzeri]|nr:hypothetical protein BC835DRAFT_1008630 [Cytidiella melzeri]